MNLEPFKKIINEAWENKNQINKNSDKNILDAISETINLLDSGKLRVAEKKNNEWLVNQWAKKAILLSFRVNEMETISGPYA
ncbi:MAG: 2,3,4,5-tetrahydropyridine-2,6-dicarboxylate N-succinyltransferase, partial [Pelagibacteraceae bacterium]|nr:2,3,4,5-tetrahydropyridine-2,6-dicarboxylate N-succinyltransferase [Pelagibacteraceae bacterium]